MIYDKSEVDEFDVVRSYDEFVSHIKTHRLPDFISFDNDLGLDANEEVAPDGYACAKWLVYESGLDLRDLTFKVHSANPVAAEQIRGLLTNYINHLKKENNRPNLSLIRRGLFWDTDIHKIDWQQQRVAVIERIFERGNDEEKAEIRRFYGDSIVDPILENWKGNLDSRRLTNKNPKGGPK
jgi:hypothetical protein